MRVPARSKTFERLMLILMRGWRRWSLSSTAGVSHEWLTRKGIASLGLLITSEILLVERWQ